MSRITLTMVVKDEASRLAAALQSVVGLVDELVIVDLGSTDGTVGLAEAAGAIVVHHPPGDAAAARSAGLSAVTGEWMLSLDPAERLAAGGAAAIRSAIERDDFDCGRLALYSTPAVPGPASIRSPGGTPLMTARLFRVAADVHWPEAGNEAAEAWMAAPGQRVRDLDAGLVREPEPRPQQVPDEPGDVSGRVSLARELLQAGEIESGRAHIAAAWAAVQADPSQRGAIVTLATLRCIQQIEQQDLSGARETLAAAAGWGADHPNLALLQGTVLEQLAHHLPEAQGRSMREDAIASLRRCLAFADHSLDEAVIPGAMGWAARARLGVCYQSLGLSDAARQEFEQAFAENPGLPEVRLGLADALMESDPARALRLVEPVAASSGIDGWLLKAGAHEVRGEDNEMARALLAGLQHIRDGFAARHRRALMDELVSLLGILQGAPRPGRGAIGALAGLMSGYPPPAGAVFPAPPGSPTARRLSKVIAYLRLRGEEPLLVALAGAPVEGLYPGIRHLLAAGN